MSLKRTPLHSIQRALGGKMIPFAGWEMPVQYESALREHLAVRQACGIFDVSHMGELELVGPDALALAQKVTCNDLSRLSDGQAQYSALLSPQGTFIDDLVVYRISCEHIFICVNASTKQKDYEWILSQCEGNVEVQDTSDRYVQLAIQGPAAERILQELTEVDLATIRFYWFQQGRVGKHEALISRTGYTGEDGFEIYFSPEGAAEIWNELFRLGEPLGMRPAGLAARNTLRLEMRYPLYGNDIDEQYTPFEAGLGWIVKLTKEDFVGKAALLAQQEGGVNRRLVGFEMRESGICRDGFPVYLKGKEIGPVTSGGFAPSLDKSIGLVYLPTEQAEVGTEFEVGIRGNRRRAAVVETPFYKRQ